MVALFDLLKDSYSVKIARTAALAIDAVNQATPDCVLLDATTKASESVGICRQLREVDQMGAVPVIFMVPQARLDEALFDPGLGLVDFVTVPLNRAVVLARVRNNLNQCAQIDQLRSRMESLQQQADAADLRLMDRLIKSSSYKDDDTGTHVLRIAEFSRLLARLAGLPESEQEVLAEASKVHDIGKVAVPDGILQKPTKLDTEEWAFVQQHCREGAAILGDPGDSRLLQVAREVILTHHEKWDGSGYPEGLKGEQIPLSGRIVALADVFDALTSDLPYKKAWTIDEAVTQLKQQAGRHFDPDLVLLFMDKLDSFIEIKRKYADVWVEEDSLNRR